MAPKPNEAEEEVEQVTAVADSEAKEPEKPKELEEDAVAISGSKLSASAVGLNMSEATLNVLPSMNDQILMSLRDGGFQYLLAGVRCTVGLKAGRYMFEAQIVEALNPVEPEGSKSPAPKQLARVGVSLSGSSVFLAETTEYCCFDSEGCFSHGKKRTKVGQKFAFGDVVAVLVNLDPSSPNANTLSLFKNGVRASEPQALPEPLKGKPLFPTVAYKNVTLRVNFGSKPMATLPFSCHMVKDAAAADAEVVTPPVPKDGVHEVLFPMGMPDAGIFEWADQFMESNPTFTEISTRKIIEWASKSGIERPKTNKGSTDTPEMNFGIPLLDDLSVRSLIAAIAPTLDRSYLVVELKANLIPEERKEALQRFGSFKRVAVVAMGEPDDAYKSKVHASLLAQKVIKAEELKKKRAQDETRKKLLEEKKKKAEKAKQARLAAQKAKAAKDAGDEAPAEPEAMEEEKKDEEKKEEDAADDNETVAELTEEEKKVWHKKQVLPDLSPAVLSKEYAKFSLPEQSEGFDEIRFAWQPLDVCSKTLKEWVQDKKMTQLVEDLEPGEWFKGQWDKWQKTLKEWRQKAGDWKNPAKKKQMLAKKKEEAKKKKTEEGGDDEVDGAEEEAMEINVEDLDVFGVEDVTDIGSGEPLFANFAYEDWTLLSFRVEFHLMLQSWKKDLNDAERPSFKENHLAFYYNKYFKKEFMSLKLLGIEKLSELIEWIKEAVTINDTGYFEAQLDEELPFDDFVKLAEEHRRDRQRRIDAGDESAVLAFSKPPPVKTAPTAIGNKPTPVSSKPAVRSVSQPSAVGQKRAAVSGPAPAATRARLGYGPPSAYGASPYGAPPPGYGGGIRPAYGVPPYGAPTPGAGMYGSLYRRV